MNDIDLLKRALDCGIIDSNTIQQQLDMNERKKYLMMHEERVWQSATDRYWRSYLPITDGDGNVKKKLIKKMNRKDLDDAIISFYKHEHPEPYPKQVFYSWIEMKLSYGEITQTTADRYISEYNRNIDGTKLSKTKICNITERMLEDFIKTTIRDKGLTQKTYSELRIVLKGIFTYAKREGYTNISISSFFGDLCLSRNSFVKKRKPNNELVFTDDEVIAIRNYIISNEREYTVIELGILLAFYTGLRPGELAALTWDNVAEDELHICQSEVRYKDEEGNYVWEIVDHTKTDAGERSVYLDADARDIVNRIRIMTSNYDYLFIKDCTRVKGQAFTRRLYRICDNLGLHRRSLNKARKTFATKLINSGVDKGIVMNQMGHTDISTTERFYYKNNRNFDEMKNKLADMVKYD